MKVEEIRVEIGEDIKASILEESTARADGDEALAKRVTSCNLSLKEISARRLVQSRRLVHLPMKL